MSAMNTLESESDRHAAELAAKVSRLKNVRIDSLFSSRSFFLVQIAIDIDNDAKEHNRFLDSMVMEYLDRI